MALRSSSYLEAITKRLLSKDSLVKGYFLVKLENINIPYNNNSFFKLLKEEDINLLINSQCVLVTLPNSVLKTDTYQGKLGYNKNVPVGISMTNDISLDFILTQDRQYIYFHNLWYDYIENMYGYHKGTRRELNGFSNNNILSGSDPYNTAQYGCIFHYWLLDPALNFVIGFVAEGFYPTNKLSSEFSSDLSVNVVKVTARYNCDYWMIYDENTEAYKEAYESMNPLLEKYLLGKEYYTEEALQEELSKVQGPPYIEELPLKTIPGFENI